MHGRRRVLLLQPGVLQSQLSRGAFLGVHREQVQQKVATALVGLRHTLPNAGLLGVQVLVPVLQGAHSIFRRCCMQHNLYLPCHASIPAPLLWQEVPLPGPSFPAQRQMTADLNKCKGLLTIFLPSEAGRWKV